MLLRALCETIRGFDWKQAHLRRPAVLGSATVCLQVWPVVRRISAVAWQGLQEQLLVDLAGLALCCDGEHRRCS
jgi:hypothetical protein